MSDEFETSQPEPEVLSQRGQKHTHALVVVWSPFEPSRVGEVLLINELGKTFLVGRGEGGERLLLHRQRPGRLERMPPLHSTNISRAALKVQRTTLGLAVQRGGTTEVRVNGEAIRDYHLLRLDDTIEVDRQIMFLCTMRPEEMPPLRYGIADMDFGAADRYGMIGESPRAWKLREDLALAAQMTGHVFIYGESGTGKELAATAIHRAGSRAAGMFVSHSAAALPPGLIDVELFGNAKNFPNPGMIERSGLIGSADGGSLFLDEIGELSHEHHAHLLRVLDGNGEYKRLGENQPRRSSFRLIAATNRDRGALKYDFLARMNLEVDLPSFRERREDVPLLARAHVLEAAKQTPAIARFLRAVEGRVEPQFTVGFMGTLVRHAYTTNAREIAKMISHSIAQSTRDVLTMPKQLHPAQPNPPGTEPTASGPVHAPMRERLSHPDQIRATLSQAGGNISEAARMLAISRPALYRLMAKFGIKT